MNKFVNKLIQKQAFTQVHAQPLKIQFTECYNKSLFCSLYIQ
jgi:hypothetical protein